MNALNDRVTDQTRRWSRHQYLNCLANFLTIPTNGNLNNVIQAAQNMKTSAAGSLQLSAMPLGNIESMTAELLAGRHDTWARLLASVEKDSDEYARFHALSPFPDRNVTVVSYGKGFVLLGPRLQHDIARVIEAQGQETWDCQEYVISFPRLPADKVEVFPLTPDRTE